MVCFSCPKTFDENNFFSVCHSAPTYLFIFYPNLIFKPGDENKTQYFTTCHFHITGKREKFSSTLFFYDDLCTMLYSLYYIQERVQILTNDYLFVMLSFALVFFISFAVCLWKVNFEKKFEDAIIGFLSPQALILFHSLCIIHGA